MLNYEKYPLFEPRLVFPFFDYIEKREYRRDIIEDKKMRMLMRGVKIGKKKEDSRCRL